MTHAVLFTGRAGLDRGGGRQPAPGVAAAVVQKHGIPRAHLNPQAIADDPDVDALVIGLPSDLHAPATVQMLQAGKHVLCEKPMALSVAEGEEMELAHRHGALFILDEMRSGFHLAMGGAQGYYGVTPDLATFSKAMSNGYAISVLAGRRELMAALSQTYVSSTFYTNSIAMAAAAATVRKLREKQMIPHLWRIGQGLLDGLDRLAKEAGVAAQTVGLAPMPFLIFTDPDPEIRETAKYLFYREVTRQGVLLHPNHHWFVSAAHTDTDLAHTLDVCGEAFHHVRAELARGYRAPAVQQVAVTAAANL